jgi:hypothetical protein
VEPIYGTHIGFTDPKLILKKWEDEMTREENELFLCN